MNAQLINRFIKLLQKTGHPVIYGNPETGQSIVVMELDEYERLIDVEQLPEPEPYDNHLKHQQANRGVRNTDQGFPAKDTRRQHRTDETLEVVLEQPAATPSQPVAPAAQQSSQDLTASAPAANINREIASQPSKKDNQSKDNRSKANVQNKSANQTNVQQPRKQDADLAPDTGLDDEERFYLEPLE